MSWTTLVLVFLDENHPESWTFHRKLTNYNYFLGSLFAADAATGKDDTGHGKICCTKRGHYHSVSTKRIPVLQWLPQKHLYFQSYHPGPSCSGRKPINTNPRLKINRAFHLAYFKCFQESKLKDKNLLKECLLIGH